MRDRMSRLDAAQAMLASRNLALSAAEEAARAAYQALPVDSPDGLLEHAYDTARAERERARRMYALMSIRADRLRQGKAL